MSIRETATAIGASCLITLCPLFAQAEQNEARKPKPLDTTYISSDAAIVAVVHPQRLLQGKSELPPFTQEMLDGFHENVGIDLRNLRQVVLQFGTDRPEEATRVDFGHESVTVVFRFEKPVKPDSIAAAGFGRNTRTTHNKATYYKPGSENQPALWFPDKRTMIVADEWRIVKLIDEPSSMGVIVSRLGEADDSHDVLIEVDVKQSEPMLREALSEVPQEKPFSPLQTIEKLERVTLTLNESSKAPLRAEFYATDEKSAVELQQQGKAILAMAKAAWPAQRKKMADGADEELKGLVDSVVRSVDAILSGMKFATDGNRLLVHVEAKPGSIDAVTFFMSLGVVGGGTAEATVEPVGEAVEDKPLERREKGEEALNE